MGGKQKQQKKKEQKKKASKKPRSKGTNGNEDAGLSSLPGPSNEAGPSRRGDYQGPVVTRGDPSRSATAGPAPSADDGEQAGPSNEAGPSRRGGFQGPVVTRGETSRSAGPSADYERRSPSVDNDVANDVDNDVDNDVEPSCCPYCRDQGVSFEEKLYKIIGRLLEGLGDTDSDHSDTEDDEEASGSGDRGKEEASSSDHGKEEASGSGDGKEEASGRSTPEVGFMDEDEPYRVDSGVIVEIKRRLIEMCDGLTLICGDHNRHIVKVFYRVLLYYGIPAEMRDEEGELIEAADIVTDILTIHRELAERVDGYDKDAMLKIKEFVEEDFLLILPEPFFLELFLIWCDGGASEADIREVWASVDLVKVCGWLRDSVWVHISTNQGYTLSVYKGEYEHVEYRWLLYPDEVRQWVTQGYYHLCDGTSSGSCKLKTCTTSTTDPCYTVAAEGDYYIVRDSQGQCSEGGHCHSKSVMWCWAMFYSINSSGESVYTYTSLLLNTREVIDRRLLTECAESDDVVHIFIMLHPNHTDPAQ